MPFPYSIGGANFVMWDGPAPDTLRYSAQGHTRPGVPGVAFHQFWSGASFAVQLESWHQADELLGLTALQVAQNKLLDWQQNYQGGSHRLIYGGVDWSAGANCNFFASDIQDLSLRTFARLNSPALGIDYHPGAVLVTRWVLTPQKR